MIYRVLLFSATVYAPYNKSLFYVCQILVIIITVCDSHTHAIFSHVHDQRTACRSRSLPLGVLKIELALPGLHGKGFYPPSHLASPCPSKLYIYFIYKGLKMYSLCIKGFSNSKYYFIIILFIA